MHTKESGWVQSVRPPGGDLITETQQKSFDEHFRSIHVHPNELEQLPLLIRKRSPEYLIHCTLQNSSGSSSQCRMTRGETLQTCHIVHSLTVSLQGEPQRRLYRDLMKDYKPTGETCVQWHTLTHCVFQLQSHADYGCGKLIHNKQWNILIKYDHEQCFRIMQINVFHHQVIPNHSSL